MRYVLVFALLGTMMAACGGKSESKPDAVSGDTAQTERPPVPDAGITTDPGTTADKGTTTDPGTTTDHGTTTDTGTQTDPGTTTDTGTTTDPGTGTDTGTTGGTCADLVACVNKNQCTTQQCFQNCAKDFDQATIQQFNDLAMCAQQNCQQLQGNAAKALCLYETCRDQNEPCVHTGTAGCMQTMMCMQQCGQNAVCQQGCVDKASYDATVTLLKLVACMEKNCPQPTQQCLMASCGTELAACQ